MQAVVKAFGIDIDARDKALLCQKVENLVVGAPCGVMASDGRVWRTRSIAVPALSAGGDRTSRAAVERVVATYAKETGHQPYVFHGSSSGSESFDHLRVSASRL